VSDKLISDIDQKLMCYGK